MKTFRVEVGDLEAARQELANAEKLFDLPITMYPNLLEVQKQMKGLEMVYTLYEEQKVGSFWSNLKIVRTYYFSISENVLLENFQHGNEENN